MVALWVQVPVGAYAVTVSMSMSMSSLFVGIHGHIGMEQNFCEIVDWIRESTLETWNVLGHDCRFFAISNLFVLMHGHMGTEQRHCGQVVECTSAAVANRYSYASHDSETFRIELHQG